MSAPMDVVVSSGPLASATYAPRRMSLEELAGMVAAALPGVKAEQPGIFLGSTTAPGPAPARGRVVSRSAVVLDIDGAEGQSAQDVADIVGLTGWEALVHGTHSWSLDCERCRVILPLSEPVSAERFPAVAAAVAAELEVWGLRGLDGSVTCDTARRMYAPSVEPGGDGELFGLPCVLVPGVAVDPGDLGPLPAPEAASHAPAPADVPPATRRDPFSLPGLYGAFCRGVDLPTAVERYGLPYEPAGPEAWRWRGSESAGLREISPGRFYDHYASSPHRGQALTVLDLVASWLYGPQAGLDGREDLDAGLEGDVAPADRPSVRRLLQDLEADPVMRAELDAEALGALEPVATGALAPAPAPSPDAPAPVVADPGDWEAAQRRCLDALPPVNPRNGRRDPRDVGVQRAILEHDPVLRSLRSSALAGRKGWGVLPPWRAGDEQAAAQLRALGVAEFSDLDSASLAAYLGAAYLGHVPSREVANDLRDQALNLDRARVDPLRDYLEGLTWDGVDRMDGALPGLADDDAWGRLAVKRAMVAAVKRVFEPGCQSDSSLVLVGAQGTRKSSWVRWLGGVWTSALPEVTGDPADLLDTCHSSWIVEADEGFAVSARGRYADALKRFLTSRQDTWRPKYGRSPATHLRRFSVWGTTNDESFLSQGEGNRRYWPVRVVREIPEEALTPERRDALWAQAVALYRAGEDSWMRSEADRAMAASAQEAATQESSLQGQVEEVLLDPRPADSAWMTSAELLVEPAAEAPARELTLTQVISALTARGVRAGDRDVTACMRALGWSRAGQVMRRGRRRSVWQAPPSWPPVGAGEPACEDAGAAS